jgi:ParB family transcriptional regulator, chromosome partitioning protein
MSDKKHPVKRNALGRGLSALIDDSDMKNNEKKSSGATVNTMNEISLDSIEVNPYQPRTHFDQEALKELSESIKVQGIIQPITVRQLSPNKYQLISGERRFQASKLAGLKTIPAYVRIANDQQMVEMALIENIQRENLNALEVALSYQRLISECNLKQEELGERVSKNRATVNNYLRLLKLPPDIQAAVRDNKITMGHARALITIENIDNQLYIFKKLIAEDLSVRKVEELVRDLARSSDKKPVKETKSSSTSYEIQNLQTKLSSHFGTKVQLKADKENKGEMKIPFVSAEDLNRILEILKL